MGKHASAELHFSAIAMPTDTLPLFPSLSLSLILFLSLSHSLSLSLSLSHTHRLSLSHTLSLSLPHTLSLSFSGHHKYLTFNRRYSLFLLINMNNKILSLTASISL